MQLNKMRSSLSTNNELFAFGWILMNMSLLLNFCCCTEFTVQCSPKAVTSVQSRKSLLTKLTPFS